MATILVVDDERLICDLLKEVLSRHGHEVYTALSGRQALETYTTHRPNAMIVDLHMPEMNGIELLKQLRLIDPVAMVMMLTGQGTDELESQARELGVTDFLRKGLSLDAVVQSINRVSHRPRGASEVLLPPTQGSDKKPKGESILVVDDERMIRDLLQEYLGIRGFHVRTAQDGAEALALVAEQPPQVVILDMYMPGMSGVDVLAELGVRQYKGKVIVLTASQDEKLLQQALNLGSVDLMSKPVDLERLSLAIHVGLALA
jgi:DNA-binding response OmpR family regulator